MKPNTIDSSKKLRTIATIILSAGLFISIISLIFGGAAILTDGLLPVRSASKYNVGIAKLFYDISVFGGIGFIVFALINFWIHYVCYVAISAQATLIENSDRSDVVEALENINDTLAELKRKQ